MKKQPRAMIVAGVMSGTSADGVDVAIVRVSPALHGGPPRLKVLAHRGSPYPKALRAELLRAMEGEPMQAQEFSRLNWKLGSVYAECVEKALEIDGRPARAHPSDGETVARMGQGRLALVGMHGQTVYHEAKCATWQLGEPAVLRERLSVPVVSDFRPADLAAGGQGAPLVPMLDFCSFHSATKNRVLLNLGGIANFTVVPAGAQLDDVLAFDIGPANVVIDGLMQAEFGKGFDRGGKIAASGSVMRGVLAQLLREHYFAATPPKSCGREQFGSVFVERLRGMVKAAGGSAEDAVATATALTATSILDAYGRFCWPHLGQRAPLAGATELIVAGGGVKNATLMKKIVEGFTGLRVKVQVSDAAGMDAQAKEAAAFALLAWLSFHGLPGNVPSATGALGQRVLGKICW
jgi:anhydro-N-acetylmuramic acid kinase